MIIEKGILTNEELVGLYQRSEDDEVRQYCQSEIIRKNEKFVMKLAHKSFKQEFDDAFQNGCIGLLRAIDTYKVGSDHKFITHAYLNVKAYINNPVRERAKDCKESVYSLQAFVKKYGTDFEMPSEFNTERFVCNKEILEDAIRFANENFDELSRFVFNEILSGRYGDGDVKRISELKSVSCTTVTNRKNKIHAAFKEYFGSLDVIY